MQPFDWQRMLLDQFPAAFLGEVAFRALVAYLLVFAFLKISGRRGVRQLSLFELVVILTLGSAAGDVAFYDDVPLLPIVVVFITLLLLYRITTLLMKISPRFGNWVEGKPLVIIRDGLYEFDVLDRQNISSDEFFMELRQSGIEHLGQVRLGILEEDGSVSLYQFVDGDVRAGLSVMPPALRPRFDKIPHAALYACDHCGHPQRLATGPAPKCPRCDRCLWSEAMGCAQ
ncbi:DUF421 domain-containing protein [Pseudomonas sp. UL073]|uniref:DUF421 domain-containing protein n=1 Tax=Zestomonas insulae TaxID=2809017 RepID=A0ABS2IG09_9GAMM|nr:YetF domain-containing protein [Pseudomonas insulae]MBM7062006.1 DUF421 domain-containing protein [Pseudomonas insulae]